MTIPRWNHKTHKITGWNIYLFLEDEEGNEIRVPWAINNSLASDIDIEYTDLVLEFNGDEEE